MNLLRRRLLVPLPAALEARGDAGEAGAAGARLRPAEPVPRRTGGLSLVPRVACSIGDPSRFLHGQRFEPDAARGPAP